jgi:hypothetical protein
MVGCKDDKVTYVHVGENWERIHNLKPSDTTFDVKVKGRENIKIGEKMDFTISSDKDGKLWVVQVDSSDQVTAIFPSSYQQDNTIKADEEITFPPKDGGYDLVAAEPLGKSTIAFIVTKGNTSLSEALKEGTMAAKALALQASDPQWGIGRIVVDVTK